MLDVEMVDMSGWKQSLEEIRTPSSLEIAIVTGRICRYAGNLPCSLLTHLMVGARVVWRLMRSSVEEARLQTFCWWMLHDAHEVTTGDFIFLKPEKLKAWQEKIDAANCAVYGINPMMMDETVIRGADLLSRWLETKFYGSEAYCKTFDAVTGYEVPSPEMQRETIGIFRSDFGRLSCCVTDENENPGIRGPVLVYEAILEAILRGDQKGAVEYYDGMVVELGL